MAHLSATHTQQEEFNSSVKTSPYRQIFCQLSSLKNCSARNVSLVTAVMLLDSSHSVKKADKSFGWKIGKGAKLLFVTRNVSCY